MNDTVHVEVEVVEFFSVWIRSSRVYRDFLTINLTRLFFDDGADDLGLYGNEHGAIDLGKALECLRIFG